MLNGIYQTKNSIQQKDSKTEVFKLKSTEIKLRIDILKL